MGLLALFFILVTVFGVVVFGDFVTLGSYGFMCFLILVLRAGFNLGVWSLELFEFGVQAF